MIRLVVALILVTVGAVVVLGLVIQAVGAVALWSAATFAGSLVVVELVSRVSSKLKSQ